MFEQDYIKRLINDIARVLAKLLFNRESDDPGEERLAEHEAQDTLEELLNMVDSGQIEEAENRIYEMTDGKDMTNLRIALSFYTYLNEKDDEFLQEHHFSREEIRFGIDELVSRYGLSGMTELFLM